jgi:hypothetical protein
LQRSAELKSKYENSIKLVKDTFSTLIAKCQELKGCFEDFRLMVWKASTLHRGKQTSDDLEILKQILFVTILDHCKFKARLISSREIEAMTRKAKHLLANH